MWNFHKRNNVTDHGASYD